MKKVEITFNTSFQVNHRPGAESFYNTSASDVEPQWQADIVKRATKILKAANVQISDKKPDVIPLERSSKMQPGFVLSMEFSGEPPTLFRVKKALGNVVSKGKSRDQVGPNIHSVKYTL